MLEQSQFLFGPAPHEEAAAFIRSKPAVSRAAFDALLPEIRARAFTVSGVQSLDALQRARDAIASLPEGENWEDAKGRLMGEIAPYMEDEEEAARRAELLLRMHGHQAYSQAAHDVAARQRDVFPYLRYQSMGDDRVRATHAALDGLILPADDPFWQNHTPPWEWGCRCQVVPMQAWEVEEIRGAEAGLPPERRSTLSDELRERLNREGELTRAVPGGSGMPAQFDVRTAREKGDPEGYEWSPADRAMSVDAFRRAYDAATFAAFAVWARATIIPEIGRTVWEWAGGR